MHLNQKVEGLIIQRSRLLVILLWIFMLLDMSKFLIDDRPLVWMALLGFGLLAILTGIVYRTKHAKVSMYMTVLWIYVYAAALMFGSPSIINFMFAWVGLMISAFYQEYGTTFLAGSLTAILQTLSFRLHGPLIFPGSSPLDIVYPWLFCVFITVFLLYLTSFTKRLWLSAERAEEQLRYVLENVDVVTWTMAHFGEALVTSEGITGIAGLTPEELQEQPDRWLDLLHPDDKDKVNEVIQQIILGGSYVTEFRLVRPDREIRWVQVRAFPIVDERATAQGLQGVLIDVTNRRLMEQRIKYLAYHDTLTGLPNRALFSELAANSLSLARRDASLRAVFFIDLNGFKQVNDSAGHDVGDLVLAEISHRLQAALRAGDVFCRLGGDEFAVLLEVKERVEAVALAEHISELISQPITVSKQSFAVTCSIGISYFPDHGTDADILLKSADKAMYQAKVGVERPWQIYLPSQSNAAGEQ